MPLSDFGGKKDNELYDGDGALSFEIPNMKRIVRLIGFLVKFSAACIVHNAQGSTFEAVVIAKMRSHGSQLESLYVAISRANSLFPILLENISGKDIAHFSKGPSQDLENEMARLRQVEESPITDLCSALPNDTKLREAKYEIIRKQQLGN